MLIAWIVNASLAIAVPADVDRLPEAEPAAVGLDAQALAQIDEAVARAIREKQVPGAVVIVGRRGRIAFARSYGQRAIEPAAEPMTRDTVFDLASLTKPIATATAALILIDRGRLRLDQPAAEHWPEFGIRGKEGITIDPLLRHRAGLIADNPLADYGDGPERAWERIAGLELERPPGARFRYSDVGFLVLGRVVERAAGRPLDQFAREAIFEPLGMGSTFLPLAAGIDPARIAPTERDGETMLRGVVHDPRARALGGVAGHAGLFGKADDLALFAQMILDGGKARDGQVILEPSTVAAMIDPADTPPQERRGLGWDVETAFSAPKGEGFGPRSFGHTGFTGTSLWIDPETGTFVAILTSRLHPDGKAPSPTRLRREVATIVAAAIVPKPTARTVATGIDRLIRDGFAPMVGKRVGLVTNHTGRASDGRATIDVLAKAEGVTLAALFSPEHGIRGAVDAKVADGRDEATGLPIYSLYGKARKPTAASLAGLDALVFDIQDVGVRFYTYISTLGLVLEAAAAAEIPVYVLDRPNPIGGAAVDGPVRDPEYESFIAHHALPVRHGMTVGELARLFNAERSIGADLTVIPCEGWRRGDLFDKTGLLWINPSPNMRSLTQAMLYPAVGLLEATNLATGRGTDTPFERVGAPWIDPVAWAADLNGRGLPGVRFVPIRFTPSERQYAGTECGGVYLSIVDWSAFDSMGLALGLAASLRTLYPETWEPEGLERFLADRASYDAIVAGRPSAEIRMLWRDEIEAFRAVRVKYLLYRE